LYKIFQIHYDKTQNKFNMYPKIYFTN